VPLSVEAFGRLGKLAMGLLNALADVAGGEGGFQPGLLLPVAE
jgi:hypothetical protein